MNREEGGVSETPSYSAGWGGFLFALDSFQQLPLKGFWFAPFFGLLLFYI